MSCVCQLINKRIYDDDDDDDVYVPGSRCHCMTLAHILQPENGAGYHDRSSTMYNSFISASHTHPDCTTVQTAAAVTSQWHISIFTNSFGVGHECDRQTD